MSAEKRGNLVKLTYDFDTSALLEVKIGDKWFRTTSKRFRSFDGERKITAPVKQPGHGHEAFQNIEYATIEYAGPVFVFDTNFEVPFRNTGKYVESPDAVRYPEADKLDSMAEKRMNREQE